MGYVFTFPEHRGHHYAGVLMDEVAKLAATDGADAFYISTGHTGLYEKYGCEYLTEMENMNGGISRVYVKKLGTREM